MFFLIIAYFICNAQTGNVWIKQATFAGDKRERCVSFSIGDKGYFATGQDSAERIKNDLWEYDPKTDSWSQKANIPGSVRRNAIGFTINNYAYVGLGVDSAVATEGNILNDLWRYDPQTNTWLQMTDYPGANGMGVYFATAFTINDKGYVCGGKVGPNNYIDELWEYKPATDSWASRSPFPGGDRYQLTSFAVNNKGYVGLGTDHESFRKDIWEFNPITNNWTRKSDFPGYERAGVSSFTIKNSGFICLGTDGGYKDDLWEYNYVNDTWIMRNNFPGGARKFAGSFVIDNNAYVGTGKGYSGLRRNFYVYIPYQALSIVEVENNFQIEISPNPVLEYSYILLREDNNNASIISLYDINGKKVWYNDVKNSEKIILKNEFISGVYHLIVTDINSKVIGVKKVIIL